MIHETEQTPQNEELTLLALGEKYALVGDGGGLVRRACLTCLNRIKTVQPRRVYAEEDAGLRDFQAIRDYFTGLGVSYSFDPASKTYFVEEVADPITGYGSGQFFFTSRDSLTFATI